MAGDEQQTPTNWFSPLDALRRVQELGAQLSGAARSYMETEAEREDEGQTRGRSATQPMAAWAERAAELSTMWVAPMRAVLQEQQDLIDAISSWAEEQRKLADRFSELADRHRQMTEGVLATLTPTLDHLDRLSGRSTASKRASKSTKARKATASD